MPASALVGIQGSYDIAKLTTSIGKAKRRHGELIYFKRWTETSISNVRYKRKSHRKTNWAITLLRLQRDYRQNFYPQGVIALRYIYPGLWASALTARLTTLFKSGYGGGGSQ